MNPNGVPPSGIDDCEINSSLDHCYLIFAEYKNPKLTWTCHIVFAVHGSCLNLLHLTPFHLNSLMLSKFQWGVRRLSSRRFMAQSQRSRPQTEYLCVSFSYGISNSVSLNWKWYIELLTWFTARKTYWSKHIGCSLFYLDKLSVGCNCELILPRGSNIQECNQLLNMFLIEVCSHSKFWELKVQPGFVRFPGCLSFWGFWRCLLLLISIIILLQGLNKGRFPSLWVTYSLDIIQVMSYNNESIQIVVVCIDMSHSLLGMGCSSLCIMSSDSFSYIWPVVYSGPNMPNSQPEYHNL